MASLELKKKIKKERKKAIICRDAATQTWGLTSQEQGGEGGTESDEENPVEVKDSQCPICLEHFRENNKITVGRCGHPLCEKCSKKLLRNNAFRCPQCRSFTQKNHLVKISQLSVASLVLPERRILLKKCEKAQANIFANLENQILEMIQAEQSRTQCFQLPLSLSKNEIKKKRSYLLAAAATNDFQYKLQKMLKLSREGIQFASEVINLANVKEATTSSD